MDHPEEQLVFILSPAPKWGNYVVYPARVADKGEYYLYLGRYGEEDMAALPDAGRSLARLCMQYELPRLYDRFGKNKYRTEQLFADKADGKELKEIRSFVDATVHGVVCSLLEEGYPLFLKEKRWENPYKKDRISLSGEVLKPLSSFHRDDTHVRYVLRLDCHGKMLYPEEAGLRIVTEQPGMVLRGHRLYRLPEGFSGMRIRPFLHKKEIIIPRASEAVYFRTFILKSVSNEDIEVEGFDIIEPPVQKQMVVWLEQNLLGKPILSVKARYNGHELSLPCDKPSIVELKEEEGGYRFYRISRDFAWEKERLAQLESLGMLREAGGWFRLKDGKGWEDMVAWAGAHRADLAESGILFSQERLRHPFYTGGHRLSYARGESMTDWFQVKAEIVLDDGYTFSLHDLWENILSGQREYLLKNGKVFLIPEEWFARYSGLFLFARQERDGSFLLRNLQSPLLEEGILSAPGHDYEPVLEPVAVPVSLKADLRGYQLKGYRWLHALYRQSAGACLADDMGLGKTVQAIALLLAYKEERPRLAKETVGASLQLDLFATAEEGDGLCRYTCLIIAPASVEHNWRNELRKFAPSLMVGSYVGMQRSRKRQALMCWDVVTTTYHTLRNDIDFLARQHFGFLVFDEAHYQNFLGFPIKSFNHLVIICFEP